MQLDDHKGLIDQLIPAYDSPDFEHLLARLTQGEPASARLLIKMELNRLMAPCSKVIDLRGRVKGECYSYQLHGITHWLDDVAINAYHKNIKRFGGKYRVGLYEILTNTRNNFRILHQQEKQHQQASQQSQSRDTQFDVNLIRFGHYLSRGESRIQIATQVHVTLPDSQSINGITSDLSYSGAKFKVPSAFSYGLGQTITARYPALAEELNDSRLNTGIEYRILGVDDNPDNDSFKWLRLIAVNSSEVMQTTIARKQAESGRYRHENNDQVLQVRTKGYEHCFLKHTTSLPLFFSGNELSYALLTEHNRSQWEYWHDERNQPVINHLFSQERMAGLAKEGLKQGSTIIYSFSHQHAHKTYFYSAALPELTVEQRQLFWHLGAQRNSWRVFRLTVYPLQVEDLEELQAVAPDMRGQIHSLTHIGILQDLTNSQARIDYRLTAKPQLPTNTLNPFCHPRTNTMCRSKAIFFEPKPLRSEPRFQYRTAVELAHPTLGSIQGSSIDFSSHGLNIQLSTPLIAKKDDTVAISFTDLQKHDKSAPVSQIPYRIVRLSLDHRNLQLVAIEDSVSQKSVHYLDRLIQHNQQKLSLAEEAIPEAAVLNAMHRMLLTRLSSVPYFADKRDHLIKPRAIGCNLPLPLLPKLFNRIAGDRNFSLAPIFKNRVKPLLADTMRPVQVKEPFIHELYICVQTKGERVTLVVSKLLEDFDSVEQRIEFIEQARRNGEFYAIRITAVPVFNPLSTLVGTELSKLAQHALHRARSLELEFNSLVGCGEMYNITDEVLIRLEIG